MQTRWIKAAVAFALAALLSPGISAAADDAEPQAQPALRASGEKFFPIGGNKGKNYEMRNTRLNTTARPYALSPYSVSHGAVEPRKAADRKKSEIRPSIFTPKPEKADAKSDRHSANGPDKRQMKIEVAQNILSLYPVEEYGSSEPRDVFK